jgi:DNA sulfur modification protein DndD
MAENRFKRHFEETVKLLQSSSIQKKQLEKIQIVEETLAKFSKELVWRSLNQFETLITSKFKYLIRKDSLVDSFTIDKQTFMISALNEASQPIQLQDLSAGERQILAISILWSLSEVANIKIPVIIDTPLGRLDSKHRHQLITKYFPEASLQTIILSTDEEIIGPYYKLCKPYVGEEYLCTENPKIKTSGTIIKGYF